MIRGFFVLLLCQLTGEAISRGLSVPVPGPVLGLVLLFLLMRAANHTPAGEAEVVAGAEVGRVSDGLLQNLSIMFVPAGVGIVQHLGLFRSHGGTIALTLIGSTVLTLIATVFTFRAVSRWMGEDTEAEAAP